VCLSATVLTLYEPIVVKLRFLWGVLLFLFDALVREELPHPAAPNYLIRNGFEACLHKPGFEKCAGYPGPRKSEFGFPNDAERRQGKALMLSVTTDHLLLPSLGYTFPKFLVDVSSIGQVGHR